MRAWIKERAQKRLNRRLRARYQQIEVQPEGRGLFNFRCHDNVVEHVRVNPSRALTICEVIYIDQDSPTLHYVLRDEAAGTYTDPTIGWWCEQAEFYLIRDLLPDDHKRIHSEFERSLKDWTHEFVGPLTRFLFRLDRIL